MATPTTTPIDGTDQAVAEQAVLVDVRRGTRVRVGERAARVAGLHAPAFHRVGAVEPEEVRMVGATSMMFTKPSRCVVVERRSPGANPGPRTAATLSASRSLGGVGPDDDHRVARGRRGRAAGPTSGRSSRSACGADLSPPARRTRSAPRGRRARGRSPRPAPPSPAFHASVERVAPPGRGRAGRRTARRRPCCSSPGSTRPPGTLPVAGHQRGDRGAPPRREPRSRACSGRCRRRWRSRRARCPARASSSPSSPTSAP